jgi:phospholipid/cholesterol/gamma-HCH transport system substrate-binding protein
MTRALSRWQAVVLGLVILLGLASGAYGLFQVGERQRLWSEHFTLNVGFPRLQGVDVGTRVRVRGLEAGTVIGVDLPQQDAADAPLLVRMRLDRRFQHLVFADATATILNEGMIGAKVIEIDPGRRESGNVADGALIAAGNAADLSGLLKQAQEIIAGVREGQGTLGKLITDERAYNDILSALEQTRVLMEKGQATADSMRQDAEAIKRLPIIRNYSEDPATLLVRPTQERHRVTLASAALFETGKAILTDGGRAKLDELGAWFEPHKIKGSDVVVAAYTDASAAANSAAAQTLTQKQAEVVSDYLKETHKIQKLGFMRSRDVKAIGLGHDAPLMPPDPGAPAARIEINVFVPH